MKKLLFAAALMLNSFCMFAADEVTAKVSGTNLNIGLENETSFVAFQMDIQLPQGITAGEISKTGRLATGNDVTINGESTATPFVIASNVLDGNVLRVVAYNLGNNAITDATGDILQIALNAAPANASDITVSNIKFVTAQDLKEMNLADAVGENGSLRGDVNLDGVVDIKDVGIILNMFLQKTPATAAGDLDGSGGVDVKDVGIVLNIFLQK